jgi:hypothetical protein
VSSKQVIEVVLAAVQLITRKPRTKRELAGLLGVSIVTVGKYVDMMLAEGLVEEVGTEAKQRGLDGRLPRGPAALVYGWVSLEAAC